MSTRQQHVAFYLPQFHPIAENDEWWGPGFTEWTNVAAARPRFRGHHQPHIPADLGFYDLRLPETRVAQAGLARAHGIDAFCYYHYWFGNGRRLLQRPFDEVLALGEPDFPFCLAWANENWTRRWDGLDRAVLMSQDYSDQQAHGRWLAQAFLDERYVRLDGLPVFLVYRASDLPDPAGITRIWRDEARQAGVGEIFLCRVESFPTERGDPRRLGFDAAVEFAPDWTITSGTVAAKSRSLLGLVRSGLSSGASVASFDYRKLKEKMLAKPDLEYTRFPCVTPGWDNSARRKQGAFMLTDSTPSDYRDWVSRASRASASRRATESLVFVNAWNEWGEGAHLEPDRRHGRGYLEAHRDGRVEAGLTS